MKRAGVVPRSTIKGLSRDQRTGAARGVIAVIGLLALVAFVCLAVGVLLALTTGLDAWTVTLMVLGGYAAVSLVLSTVGWLAVRNAAPARDVPMSDLRGR